METDREKSKNRLCGMINGNWEEGVMVEKFRKVETRGADINVKEEDRTAEKWSWKGANDVGGGPLQIYTGINTEESEDAPSETTDRRDIKNPSYWDWVDQAGTLAYNTGTRTRWRHHTADAADLLEDKDGNSDLDQSDSVRGGRGGDVVRGRREERTTYESRMRRRAITSDTVMGRSSNLGAWRDFLWRIIRPDSSNPDGDNGDPMGIFYGNEIFSSTS